MRKRDLYRWTILSVFILLFPLSAAAQTFGNEWIDFNQSYYRIRLLDDGIYRLTQSDLANAGIPIQSLDPRRIQLFYRGQEQAIVIEGQQDGSFDTSDFIEFYGKRNDGTPDTELYISPTAQPHTRHNLFSDSSSYFLTWKLSPQNGKRSSVFFENNVGGIPVENYHLDENLVLNTNNYSPGRTYVSGDVLLSTFDTGEGWTGPDIANGNSATFTLSNIDNTFTSGPNPNLNIVLVGRNNREQNIDIFVGPNTGSLRQLGNAQFNAHDIFNFNSDILWTDIDASGELIVRVDVMGISPEISRAAVSLIDLDIPQSMDMNNQNSKKFRLEINPGDKSFIDVINSPGSIRLYDITDPNNIVRIGVNQTANQFDAVVPLTSVNRDLIAYNTPLSSFVIQEVDFQEISPSAHNYLVISHPDLMQSTSSGGPDPIDAFRNYRESADGGSFSVFVVDIFQLYDQFNFGEPSPLAIRRFADFMLTNGNPQFLFLIGEALDIPNNPDRQTKIALEASGLFHFVPTMGFPGSDIALLAGLQGTDVGSPIAVGRITATTPDQVQAYLDKLIEYESTPFDNLWRKRLLHLSGGTTPFELVFFKSTVDGFKETAEGDFLGGSVSTVSKQSSSPIELFNVSEAVNNGLGLITFFGHSGPNGSDIDIGRVSNPSFGYDNKGLYNTIIVNGCNAGDVFGTFFSLGEDWILTADKGSIAYMAHSDNGISTELQRYSNMFYSVAYGDSTFIAKSVGEIINETGSRYIDQFTSQPIRRAQVQQFILQGDPATTLFGANQPDYSLTENDIFITSFDGEPVTALTDSFQVNMIVRNFGITSPDSIEVSVNRFLSDGSIENFGPELYEPIKFEDTVSLTIRAVANQAGFGNNRFEVILDQNDLISELSEVNNSASIDFFISSGTTINLFPENFGIVAENQVHFVTQSSDLLSQPRGFLFELDTTKSFNSPLFTQRSGEFKVLAEWIIDLPLTPNDTLVYYWRTKFSEILSGEEDIYAESSFTYIPGSPPGWAQSDFDQIDLLTANGLVKNEVLNQWDFLQTQLSALIKTHGTSHFAGEPVLYDSLSLMLDGQEFLRQNLGEFICRSNSLNAIAFDKSTLFPYIVFGINTPGSDPQKCGKTPFVINNVTDSEIVGPNLVLNDYIDNIPDGDIILLFSIGDLQYPTWPASVISQLNDIGVTSGFLSGLTTGQPVIIIGEKGAAPGSAIEITATASDKIQESETLTGSFTDGTLTTPRIGPASQWIEFFRAASVSELPNTDIFSYDLLGIDKNGDETPLFFNLGNGAQDLSTIDSDTYPFIRLVFKTEDITNSTPTQLNKWQVTFEGVPEGILLTNDDQVNRDNTIERAEGEPLVTTYYFKNISNLNFTDSIPVNLTTFNMERRESEVISISLPPLNPNDSVFFDYNLSTLNKVGLNDINVFVNPNELPEVSINNNIIDINDFVRVNPDGTNPILDVTFDGVYILDGDIVSPSPRILVRIKDDNQYLLKQDTTGVEIALKPPCQSGCNFERVNFSSSEISLTPADEETDFQIEFNPQNLGDGIYGLQVQGADFSGNQSGVEPYAINFEVINESSITHFYPYPNPFSTSTRFVFTLTGSEIPDEIKIQIMTVSGKIVREITQDELGPIHIGNNLTDYAWDGRDEFGDQLANGVYLYRVILRNNGEKMERRETSADKAFKNGFGKLYLLR